MKEYRTTKQFEFIFESMINGNWTQAAAACVEYGFYAQDLIEAYEANSEPGQDNKKNYEYIKDIAILAEMAEGRRK